MEKKRFIQVCDFENKIHSVHLPEECELDDFIRKLFETLVKKKEKYITHYKKLKSDLRNDLTLQILDESPQIDDEMLPSPGKLTEEKFNQLMVLPLKNLAFYMVKISIDLNDEEEQDQHSSKKRKVVVQEEEE